MQEYNNSLIFDFSLCLVNNIAILLKENQLFLVISHAIPILAIHSKTIILGSYEIEVPRHPLCLVHHGDHLIYITFINPNRRQESGTVFWTNYNSYCL